MGSKLPAERLRELSPSLAGVMTRTLKEAAELLGIPLVDHLVIGDGRYVSMADRGLM